MSVGVVACNTHQIGPVWLGVLVKQTGVRMWLRACRGGRPEFVWWWLWVPLVPLNGPGQGWPAMCTWWWIPI